MDEQQFEIIYEKYKDLLYRIAFSYTKNPIDTEDILQEVFIKRVYKSPEFEGEEHEKRWMIRVTVNLCKNHMTSFWNRNRQSLDMASVKESWNMYEEEQGMLEEILALPSKCKVSMYLHYYEGYTCKEIAEILKCKESTVKMRLKKGREILRFQMEERG